MQIKHNQASVNLYDVAKCRLVIDSTNGHKHVTQIIVYDKNDDSYAIYLHNDKQPVKVVTKNF